jgi:hypothetical protein
LSRTSTLRRQHGALLALAGEIGDAGGRLTTTLDAERLHRLLEQFDAILTTHLALEDGVLYPEMLAAGDRAAALASRFCKEMGGLMGDYAAFAARWSSLENLLADPDGFMREWTVLEGALGFRIQRENAELYPLADAIGEARGQQSG